jgi:hypothetical protein
VQLERWTIGEMMEGITSLLRSRFTGDIGHILQQDEDSATEYVTTWHQESLPEPVTLPDDVSRVAEDQLHSDAWEEEEDSFFRLEPLEEHINRHRFLLTGDKLEAMPPRRLREGDVFWALFVSEAPSMDLDQPHLTTEFVQQCETSYGIFIDITSAARAALKETYDRAVKPSVERDRGMEPA